MLGEPRFWSRELRDGAVLEEAVPAGTVLFLTGVAITPNASAAGRTGLWAKSGDLKALLCTLSASKQVDAPQVRQPFTVDVTFSLTGEKATVQLSGYTRGAPPSAKTLGGKALPREATDGKAAAGKASTRLMAVSGGHKRRPASIAADAKAVPSDQLLGLAEKEAEDDESEGEGESEEESEGEGEGESEGEKRLTASLIREKGEGPHGGPIRGDPRGVSLFALRGGEVSVCMVASLVLGREAFWEQTKP